MNLTSNSAILTYITSVASQIVIGNLYDVQALPRRFIGVPIGLYNHPIELGIYPPDIQNITGYLRIPAYRVSRLYFSAQYISLSLLHLPMHL
jgi:hypothetical protein